MSDSKEGDILGSKQEKVTKTVLGSDQKVRMIRLF